MRTILFTVTFFTGFVMLIRCVCKNHISAGLQYALWLFVAVKLLVFPVPDVEGSFSILSLAAAMQDGSLSEQEPEKAAAGGYADGMQQAGPGTEGDLWGQEGQTAPGGTAAGTDTDDGRTNPVENAENRFSGRGVGWDRMELRLRHYMENTLKAPLWLILLAGGGSILCALSMTVYHLRLRSYLRKNRVELPAAARKPFPGFGVRDENKAVETGKKPFSVYGVEGLPTPCLFGKSIYVPARLAEDEEILPYVLKHEMCHYRHGDTFWGVVRMACVCLYWYHPLVWLAAYLSRQDCELACDEAVVRNMAGHDRKLYGELLLEFALVKSSPADCFSMTTAMSGNAKNLKQRLERIAGKKKNRIFPGIIAAALVLTGIFACITSGVVSPDRQRQSLRIREGEGSIPLQENYEMTYRLSRDAASYGFYVEQYEYGELVSAEAAGCASLRPEGQREKTVKKEEAVFFREVESDEITGAYVKTVNSYSIQDFTASDGAKSVWKAFTLELPEGCIGNSFSFSSAAEITHRFRMNEDIILLADYYGDSKGLQAPSGHTFAAEKYMDESEEILKNDRCVILVHLIVSDKTAEELREQLEEKVKSRGTGAENMDMDPAGLEGESSAAENAAGYSNAELMEMAGNYYREEHGFMPGHIEIDSENGNQVTIWLYDVDEFLNADNEISGSANTRDWYTVDRTTGKGENVLFEEIDLTRAEPVSRRWEGAPDGMTVTDIREEEAFFALPAEPEAGKENRIYLLGETAHYRLYGAGDYRSMIWEEGDSYMEIAVPFIVDGITMMPPGIQEADYDNDGEAELAVKLLWGVGTGIREEQLWMLDKEAGEVNAYEYHSGAYSSELLRELSWYQEGREKRILLDGQPISPRLTEEKGVSYEELSINSSRVSFAFRDGKIRLRTLIVCGRREGSVEPAYGDACLEAEVVYGGNGDFHIEDAESADRIDMKALAREAVEELYAPRGIEIVNYVYQEEAWRFSEEEGERAAMTLTVLEDGSDSYDFAEVPLVRDGTGEWRVDGEILIEK